MAKTTPGSFSSKLISAARYLVPFYRRNAEIVQRHDEIKAHVHSENLALGNQLRELVTSEFYKLHNELKKLVHTENRALHDDLRLLRDELEFVRTHLSSYLGGGIAVTHLVDETPIYVNSDDFGPPANFINGGRYEEDNLAVLLAFVRDDSVVLDIGANLGFYSLRIAGRVNRFGKIHAFEPHPFLQDLFRRSVFLNGIGNIVELHPCGLSDRNASVRFSYPSGHLGGGTLHFDPETSSHVIESTVRRLDDLLGHDFSCDIVKIDVEGHELQVLRGMPHTIANSPRLKILFENFETGVDEGRNEIEALLTKSGFVLHGVGEDITLCPLAPGELARFRGCVLAARPGQLNAAEHSVRFSIYPRQLSCPSDTLRELSRDKFTAGGRSGQILFHGPYWFLPKGTWRLNIRGEIHESIEVTIATRFGHPVSSFHLHAGRTEGVFVSEHDLVKFECVGRALTEEAKITVERIDLRREG